MITFTNDSYVVTVKTGPYPIDEWQHTYDELIGLLQAEDQEMSGSKYHVLELLRQMIPDRKTSFTIAKE